MRNNETTKQRAMQNSERAMRNSERSMQNNKRAMLSNETAKQRNCETTKLRKGEMAMCYPATIQVVLLTATNKVQQHNCLIGNRAY